MGLWIGFIVISAGIVYISRDSLRVPGSHGYYRFFAWECILALSFINIPVWFSNPLAWNQLISWFLLILAFVPLIFGIRGLTSKGRPALQREGQPELLAFEKTSRLVTTGVYHYIRHPMYSSLLLLAWGTFFKDPAYLGLMFTFVSTALLYATAVADEAECIRFFGPAYREYMMKTRRFVPFVF